MTQWQDRIIGTEEGDPSELVKRLHPDNPKTHPEAQLDSLEHSLARIGWIARPIWNKQTGYFLDGNGRIKLAMVSGQDRIKYDVVDLSPEEEKYILLTFDTLVGMAEPDAEKLLALMDDVGAELPEGVSERLLEMIGEAVVEEGETGGGSEAQVDKAEELQEEWQVKSGDVWLLPSATTLGQFHRLKCGDCRNAEDIARLVDGRKMNGVFTSPPYAEQRKKQYGGVPTGEYVEWWEAVQSNVKTILADDGSFFVNIKEHCEDGQRILYCKKLLIAMVERWGWRWVDELCWTHQGYPGGYKGRFRNEFEPVYHFAKRITIKHSHKSVLLSLGKGHQEKLQRKKDGDALFQPGYSHPNAKSGMGNFQYYTDLEGRQHGNVISISIGANNQQAASFPLKLPTFFIRAYSDSGDIWLDPFAGSGTVGIAAEKEERLACLMEILPKYCSVILQRFLDITGLTPELEKTK